MTRLVAATHALLAVAEDLRWRVKPIASRSPKIGTKLVLGLAGVAPPSGVRSAR